MTVALKELIEKGKWEDAEMAIQEASDADLAWRGRLIWKPNGYFTDNSTLLHLAIVKRAPIHINQLLLDRGLDPNALNDFCRTPVYVAAFMNVPVELMELLLDRGGDVNRADASGQTAVYCAAEEKVSIELMGLLLNRGGDVNQMDTTGKSPVSVAAEMNAPVELMSLMLDRGGFVNLADAMGETPLHLAAKNGASIELVTLLIDRGANLESKSKEDKTPRDLAMENHHKHLYQILSSGPSISSSVEAMTTQAVLNKELHSQKITIDNKRDDTSETNSTTSPILSSAPSNEPTVNTDDVSSLSNKPSPASMADVETKRLIEEVLDVLQEYRSGDRALAHHQSNRVRHAMKKLHEELKGLNDTTSMAEIKLEEEHREQDGIRAISTTTQLEDDGHQEDSIVNNLRLEIKSLNESLSNVQSFAFWGQASIVLLGVMLGGLSWSWC